MKTNVFSLELNFNKFEKFLELFEDAVLISNQEGKILLVNSKAEKLFQYSKQEFLELTIEDLIPQSKRDIHTHHRAEFLKDPKERDMGKLPHIKGLRKNGQEFPVKIALNPIHSKKGILISSEIRDISNDFEVQNKLLNSEKYSTGILEAISARILVINQNGTVEVTNRAWRDFYKTNEKILPVQIGIGDNLFEFANHKDAPYYETFKKIAKEIDLILKGEKQTFNFEYLIPVGDKDFWFLLEISKMNQEHGGLILTFFDITKQKKAQQDLLHSYETTLEGWSRAMDLRDKETEGHTQRVTKMTISIARQLGISEDEIVHIRRGALLHDMGKLGVPDQILFKAGKLDDDEWAIMKKHPQYAYDMLYPIEYLRSSLDIPYCHHEKWDGSGYPQGLKGEEIPLAARIFSVVDVWDALSSDRPYRKGWSQEKVLEYILENSGSHFDPKIVKIFKSLLEEYQAQEIDNL